MQIRIGYLLDTYGWDKCIDVFGWSPYFIRDGRGTEKDTEFVTEEQLDKLEGRKNTPCKDEDHIGSMTSCNNCKENR